MKGKLYGIGVGPGDPELITIKAKKILEKVQCLAVPKASTDKASQALTIARGAVDCEKEILELIFPMSFDDKVLDESWNLAVRQVSLKLDSGMDVAFITLGDPTVYSTYIYLHKTIREKGYETEIIPGVTSFCASAAAAGLSLGENRETIAIVPSAYECANLDDILDNFDNVVLMKISKNMDKLKKKLETKGLSQKAVVVSRCGMEDETISFGVDGLTGDGLSYFSTMIIKKSGVK